MSYIQFMFATPELEEILTQWKTFSQGTVERLILVGAIVLVSAWGLIWALFFRKSRRHRHRHHRRAHPPGRRRSRRRPSSSLAPPRIRQPDLERRNPLLSPHSLQHREEKSPPRKIEASRRPLEARASERGHASPRAVEERPSSQIQAWRPPRGTTGAA